VGWVEEIAQNLYFCGETSAVRLDRAEVG
jgi:hypothetical protein